MDANSNGFTVFIDHLLIDGMVRYLHTPCIWGVAYVSWLILRVCELYMYDETFTQP